MSNRGYGYAFLSGALIGAAVGLLFAPKRGDELRKDIKIKTDEVYEKVASYDYAGSKEALSQKVHDFKNVVSEMDAGKVKDLSMESLEGLKVKAQDLVSSAKKEVKKGTPVETPEVETPVQQEEVNVPTNDVLFDEEI